MTSRSLLLSILLIASLVSAARCGGGAGPAPSSGFDPESGETRGGDQTSRAKKPVRAALKLGQIPVLSLDGIPMPQPASEEGTAPDTGEKGKAKTGALPPRSVPAPDDNGVPPRNLFAVEEDPALVAERRRQAEETAQKAQDAAKKAQEARLKWQGPPLPPPPPQPPAIPFQFIGYLGSPEDRIGVFFGPGLFLAKKGDAVQARFKIVSIGYESAEIGFQGFAQTQRIPLTAGGK